MFVLSVITVCPCIDIGWNAELQGIEGGRDDTPWW